jgi:hypothetical protein
VSLLGVHLTLLIGPTVAVPAPPWLLEALDGVTVKHAGDGTSGFELTFRVGRSGPYDLHDYKLLAHPVLRTDNRVILVVTFHGRPRVLMDGVITHQQLSPSNDPGASTLTVKGVDLSALMDRQERTDFHPAQPETVIVLKLLARYMAYGIVPLIVPPKLIDFPNPLEWVPNQRCTDLAYIRALAKRHGYVFYIRPGPAPFTNTAYWGPPIEGFIPQKALSYNLGGETNVESLDFRYDAEAAAVVSGLVQDPGAGVSLPVRTFASFRLPPLAAYPALQGGLGKARRELLDGASGLTWTQAFGRAQARTNLTAEKALTAEGELDSMRYGEVLRARRLVGVRGAGYRFDGLYLVQEVSHTIRKGEYKQRFTLTREGLGSTVPRVPV